MPPETTKTETGTQKTYTCLGRSWQSWRYPQRGSRLHPSIFHSSLKSFTVQLEQGFSFKSVHFCNFLSRFLIQMDNRRNIPFKHTLNFLPSYPFVAFIKTTFQHNSTHIFASHLFPRSNTSSVRHILIRLPTSIAAIRACIEIANSIANARHLPMGWSNWFIDTVFSICYLLRHEMEM